MHLIEEIFYEELDESELQDSTPAETSLNSSETIQNPTVNDCLGH